jgi:hypothetical protein
LAIFVSARVALYETIQRFIHPEGPDASVGTRGRGGDRVCGKRARGPGPFAFRPQALEPGPSPTATAPAPTVSLGVVARAALVAVGLPLGDPIVGLLITLVIFKITWDSWRLVSTTDPARWSSTLTERSVPNIGKTRITPAARYRCPARNAATGCAGKEER